MYRKFLLSFIFCFLFFNTAYARHEKLYFGGGYQQPLLFSWKNQGAFAPTPGDSIRFWPGFGAYLVGGYEFDNPNWLGVAVPVSWGMMYLNHTEWVHLINADAEVLFHFLPPDSKSDFYLAGLVGFNNLTEGNTSNDSSSIGPEFGAALGFNYTLMEYAIAGSPNITNLSLNIEVPVKIILFLNDEDLADSKTTPFISVPVRVGLTYSF